MSITRRGSTGNTGLRKQMSLGVHWVPGPGIARLVRLSPPPYHCSFVYHRASGGPDREVGTLGGTMQSVRENCHTPDRLSRQPELAGLLAYAHPVHLDRLPHRSYNSSLYTRRWRT